MSLRRRLVLGLLVLVAAIVGAAFAANALAMRTFLTERLDTQLKQTPVEMIGFLCDGQLVPPGPQPPLTFFVARVTATGAPLGRCRDIGSAARGIDLPPADGARLVAAGRAPVQIEAGGMTLRAVAAPLLGRPGEYGVVALPTTEIDATMQRLTLLEVVLSLVALAIAACAGMWGIRASLRPLREITGTARAVTDAVSRDGGGLDHRVPAGPPGTEVGQLATAFNQMLTEVQTEVAARQDNEIRMRQFLADASHELRTPLTTLRGYAELLRLRAARAASDGAASDRAGAVGDTPTCTETGTDREEWLDALWRIESEGTRMARLVDDLLTLARSDQHEPAPHAPVHVDRLVREVVIDLRTAHPGRCVTVLTDPGCVVTGNADQLRQIVTNLLENAAVHTREAGEIRVSVRNRRRVEVVVDDDGPGMTARDAAHVFDRFWRADDARSRVRGGSGLGLAIVDALVTAHGGTIDFRTAPASGTTVTIALPRTTTA